MSTKRTHHLKGFTMIELVMVIVIIGILAAAALPRFANLSGQAQIAANQGIAGALRSSVGIAHTAWIAAGASTSIATVTLDNTGVAVNTSGWPSNTGADAAGCATLIAGLLVSAPTTTSSTCSDTPCYVSTYSGSTCSYQLYSGSTVLTGRTITYDTSTGIVSAT